MTAFLRSYVWIAVKFSRRIIAVSEKTRSDLLEIYGIPPEKVTVVYNGYDRRAFRNGEPDRFEQLQLKSKLGISRPYLFHHGTVQPRKNLERLIRAHRLLLERHPNLELDMVLVGSFGWLYEPVVAAAAKASCSRGRVVLTGPIPDNELVLLLKGAELCVIPSLYEGFCLPMVEAMACGVPTITSNSSCFPEVSGRVLKYFDPLSIEEMAETIDIVLHDTVEKRRLIAAGLERSVGFSWERSARETLSVINAVSGNLGAAFQ
jgi:glycosyltransferase involved in cell wall biosynthesis